MDWNREPPWMNLEREKIERDRVRALKKKIGL